LAFFLLNISGNKHFCENERTVIVNVDYKPATGTVASEKSAANMEQPSMHLEFRQIIVHDFADDAEPQQLRLHFHYRGHSKHLAHPRRAS
jgi:hypothetical protein